MNSPDLRRRRDDRGFGHAFGVLVVRGELLIVIVDIATVMYAVTCNPLGPMPGSVVHVGQPLDIIAAEKVRDDHN
ncbi:MAG: hypothetical protein ACTHJW_17885 [Streptosporangiaceae bacterium]